MGLDIFAELHQLLEDTRTTNYLTAASLSVLAYDQLITLEDEVDLIWKRGIGVTKVIYVRIPSPPSVRLQVFTYSINPAANRYFTLAAIAFNASFMMREIDSDKVFWITSNLVIGTIEFVLALRVWILFGRSRVLLVILSVLVVGEVTSIFYVLVSTISSFKTFIHLGPSLPGCFPFLLSVPPQFQFTAIAPLAVACIMFGLTSYQCIVRYLEFRTQMPVMELFIRDGFFWFLGAVGSVNLTIGTRGRETLLEAITAPSLAIYSIIASRALINIQGLGRPDRSPVVFSSSGVRNTASARHETESQPVGGSKVATGVNSVIDIRATHSEEEWKTGWY
ncbi:hypothetical protein GALMADRAFT_138096 [Galerina marginata CBS 339.88]|uniref:DUF6533 domain-containing protein n=1 Tax=Galerina marginata (strain CBS 339.88) TaxID=685588 RepID=A0A067TG74_GALM3|nr:hypothetical protein GALMADRAFT_138096 [Galerina marginata CBS 339.88]